MLQNLIKKSLINFIYIFFLTINLLLNSNIRFQQFKVLGFASSDFVFVFSVLDASYKSILLFDIGFANIS